MPRKLDLRTGRAVWFAYRAPTVHFDELTRDAKADVLIVGMGISSAMMAEALTAQGRSVICVDRRGPLKGSTPATTALVQFEIDQPLTTLSRMIGKAAARQAWRRSRLAVTNLRGRIDELGINCDLIGRQSLYLAGSTLGPSDLRAEAEARREAGIAAEYLTASELKSRFGIVRDGAILSHNNLALNPRQLTAGLFKKALQRKAKFYSPVEATTFHDTRDEVIVGTKNGPTITAKHVVLATGYELTDIVNLWPSAAFIWEASDPYLYMRSTSDGRVICGGEDEEFSDEETRDKLLAHKAMRISEKLSKLMPRIDSTPEFSWTGSFGTTTTGLPYIGAIPRHPRIFAVMGYGGNGITFSQIASEVVSASLENLDDMDAGLFAFNR
jgi:glycine/D-amino acid oxidase-like deaminating enzyme